MKTALLEKLEKLPDSLQKEVEDFVDFMIFKDQQKQEDAKKSSTNDNPNSINTIEEPDAENSKPKRGFGGLKGFVTYMSDDFDAPLKEFHDYMYHISIEFIEKIEKLSVDKQNQIEASVDAMLKEVEG